MRKQFRYGMIIQNNTFLHYIDMIESNCGEFMDVTYSEDKTIMTMHGPTEHGGVMTRVAMYEISPSGFQHP